MTPREMRYLRTFRLLGPPLPQAAFALGGVPAAVVDGSHAGGSDCKAAVGLVDPRTPAFPVPIGHAPCHHGARRGSPAIVSRSRLLTSRTAGALDSTACLNRRRDPNRRKAAARIGELAAETAAKA